MTFKQGLLALVAVRMLAAAPPVCADGDSSLVAARPAGPGKAMTPPPRSAGMDQPRVLVRQIKFSGNTVIGDEELNAIVGPQQGKELSLADLQAIAARVTDFYHDRGYFLAKVVVPEQDIARGVATLRILEGRLGELIITGNQRYREEYIRKAFAKVQKEKVIRQQTLERALLILNDMSGIEVTSVLQAGKEVGTTDIAIKVVEQKRVQGSFEFNNFGTRLASRYRLAPHADVVNFSGVGDLLSLHLVSGPSPRDFFFGRLGYSIPMNASGTKLNTYFLAGNFEVGDEFSVLGIKGSGLSAGISMTHPLWKSRLRSMNLDFGLDLNDADQQLLGARTSADRIRKYHFGMTLDQKDRVGRNYLALTIHHGLGQTFGGMPAQDPLSSRSFSGADNRFVKFTADLARVHRLSERVYVIGRASAQITSRPLVVGEQLAIGGADSVRGYPQSAFLGDQGYTVSLEARFSPLRKQQDYDRFQIATFVDHGSVTLQAPTPGQLKSQSITGLGFGFRANLPHEFSLRADMSFNVGQRPSTGGTAVPYIQVMKKF